MPDGRCTQSLTSGFGTTDLVVDVQSGRLAEVSLFDSQTPNGSWGARGAGLGTAIEPSKEVVVSIPCEVAGFDGKVRLGRRMCEFAVTVMPATDEVKLRAIKGWPVAGFEQTWTCQPWAEATKARAAVATSEGQAIGPLAMPGPSVPAQSYRPGSGSTPPPPGFGANSGERDDDGVNGAEDEFEDTEVDNESGRPGGEFGGYLRVTPGAAGGLRNVPLAFSPGILLTVGQEVRYHLSLGFVYMGQEYQASVLVPCNSPLCTPSSRTETTDEGFYGISISPATMGVPITLYDETVTLTLEPLANFLELNLMGGEEVSVTWDFGIGAQVILNYESLFVSLAPVNLQFRILRVVDDFDAGIGFNWPIRLAAGYAF